MTRRLLATAVILAILTGAAAPALSQTSAKMSAEYDAKADVLLLGKVTGVERSARHIVIRMDVSGVSGQSTETPARPTGAWTVETDLEDRDLLSDDLRPDRLKPGAEVVVRGYWAVDKRCTPEKGCRAWAMNITIPDGRKLGMGSWGTGAPRDGSDASEK